MTRYPDEYGKKWKTGKQMKPGWKKQQEKEEKKEMEKPRTDKEIAITRIVAKKEEEEKEELIELRATKEMLLQRFHKYLKVFEKKDSERMPTRKA